MYAVCSLNFKTLFTNLFLNKFICITGLWFVDVVFVLGETFRIQTQISGDFFYWLSHMRVKDSVTLFTVEHIIPIPKKLQTQYVKR